ncbi:hypothetical protein GN956_G8299 [Arapaima gigas]
MKIAGKNACHRTKGKSLFLPSIKVQLSQPDDHSRPNRSSDKELNATAPEESTHSSRTSSLPPTRHFTLHLSLHHSSLAQVPDKLQSPRRLLSYQSAQIESHHYPQHPSDISSVTKSCTVYSPAFRRKGRVNRGMEHQRPQRDNKMHVI